ncbi:hypothetical protein NUW58_g2849 [Xylaria curta]|uniref:Uncharacterized protein n=1 Tax=Xylaria curta TaxID=42375 RepID=A0ACC1PE69_9PEZI|nr:hypothetical protein NUW58_g2849 [Xylaria curta]
MQNHLAADHPLAQPLPATWMDDQEILHNIDGRMHGPMSRFIKKYFGNFQYVYQDDASLEIQLSGRVVGRCAVPSAAPSPGNFLQWFSSYLSRELDGARGLWHINETADDGACLLLAMPASSASNVRTSWDHVQVIGQFYRRSVCYRDGLLRLCRSARQVFSSQPTRLFLHGFYIRGVLIELWAFDRSGLYCSDVFDVQKDFPQFLNIILSYQQMTDYDLGKLSIIETDTGGNYIVLDSVGKLYLESQPIAFRDRLVGTGTTCYRARSPDSNRWSCIVKFKWRWGKERPENELLTLAKEKRVWGAVSLDYYKELESTANLRAGIRWGTHRKFTESSPDEKRESIEEKQREITYNAKGLAEYTEETDNFFQNRILACIVTSPVGRPLHTFRSLSELLQVFCDAIKCHRSLYRDAKILHQDISLGNMIILENQGEDDRDEEKPEGILIDLDSAQKLTEVDTERRITGTRPFMAIGVLKSECHTYRHDLESFLYVFLWTIITNHADNPPETSRLQQWSNGDWNKLAARKSLDMEQETFQNILDEFTPEFHCLKPLVMNLHRILFPLRDGVVWIGTDDSPEAVDSLYDGMIRAFEDALASRLF